MTDSIIHYLTESNTMEDYFTALAYLVGTILAFVVFQKFIVSKIVDKDETDERVKRRVEAVVRGIDTFLSLQLVTLIGVYFASSVLTLPVYFDRTLRLIVLFAAAYYFLQGSFTVLDFVLQITKDKTGQAHILDFLRFMVRMFILVLVILWFLSSMGIDITAFLAGFGILGLGFAFALQNVIADLFASITIYLDKPFEIGDTIKIGSDVGTVEKIGLKSTHLRTHLGNQLIISNRELTNQRVHNMKRMETRMVELIMGVHYETPHEKLEQIPEVVKEIVEGFDQVKFNYVYLIEFGASTLNYKLNYRITTKDAMVWLKTQQSVNLAILAKFEEMGIEMPYPIQKVIVENS